MKKISIIMPAYNVETYISRSIESVLEQTFIDWELIIIDDGSTDQTAKVVAEFVGRDDRIYLMQQENLGVSAARNKGIKFATGDYIAFLDSDDTYDSQFIELMLSSLIDNNGDISFCKYSIVDPSGKTEFLSNINVKKMINNSFSEHIVSEMHTYVGMGFMYRRELLVSRNILFDESTRNCEDLEFLLTACYSSQVCFVPEYLYIYTNRPNSASKAGISVTQIKSVLRCFNRMVGFFSEKKTFEAQNFLKHTLQLKSEYNNYVKQYAWKLLKLGEYDSLTKIKDVYVKELRESMYIEDKGLKRLANNYKKKIILCDYKVVWKAIYFIIGSKA